MTARLLCGDVRGLLQTLPEKSVRCCVTSPPYWGLRDYGEAGQIGLEATPEAYVAELVAVFREVRRLLTDDGTLWLNLGDSYAAARGGSTPPAQTVAGGVNGQGGVAERRGMKEGYNPSRNAGAFGLKHKDLVGIPWMVAFALRQDGWYLRRDIIWAKPNPMPESVRDRPTSSHEYIFLLTKNERYYYDADAVAEEAVVGTDPRRVGQLGAGGNGDRNDSKQDTLGKRTYSGFNARYASVEPAPTRNARSVWTIATQPYTGAHFATFPEELPTRCIKAGTSEKGGCEKCGAPMVRMTTKEREYDHTTAAAGKSKDGPYAAQTGDGAGTHDIRHGVRSRTTTTGWSASCQCGVGCAPDTVLDPFGGSGTTAAIAVGLGRKAIHIDLNPKYIELAKMRIGPMLCE